MGSNHFGMRILPQQQRQQQQQQRQGSLQMNNNNINNINNVETTKCNTHDEDDFVAQTREGLNKIGFGIGIGSNHHSNSLATSKSSLLRTTKHHKIWEI